METQIDSLNKIDLSEVFDLAAAANPDSIYLIETLEITNYDTGDHEWQNMAEAKVILLTNGGALYVDDIDGYKIMNRNDFESMCESAGLRLTAAN